MSITKCPIYQEISSLLQAIENCTKSNNTEWQSRHEDTINTLCKEFMPSGCGIDCGTKLDWNKSQPERIVFNVPFHHMDENGFYDGWTDYTVIVKPSLADGFDLRIKGKDRNCLKDYLAEIYSWHLRQNVWQDATAGDWHSDLYYDANPQFANWGLIRYGWH